MSIKINPTFLLKGVDPVELVKKYVSGNFNSQFNKSKIPRAKNNISIIPSNRTGSQDPVFSVKDRFNNFIIISTSNHENFKVFTESGGELKKGGICDRCHKTFEHTGIGYPVKYNEKSVLSNDRYRIIYVFYIEGCFCCFEHCLEYVNLMLSQPLTQRDNMLNDAASALKFMHSLIYPGQTLLSSNNPCLLKNNGGSLTEEEWEDKRYIYVPTDRLLLIPVKREHIRFDN